MQEGTNCAEIPFSEVILAATGRSVFAIDPKNEADQRVIKQISGVLDEVMRRLNAPDSVIQGIPRINEVSSHFEDFMRELLNTAPGLSLRFPRTAEDRIQRSGYPDLRLVDQETKRVFYLDPKLYAVGSRDSSFRTFYFEPKSATNKVRDDAVHFIVGFEHETRSGTLEFHSLGSGRSRAFQSETQSRVPRQQSRYVSARGDCRDEREMDSRS